MLYLILKSTVAVVIAFGSVYFAYYYDSFSTQRMVFHDIFRQPLFLLFTVWSFINVSVHLIYIFTKNKGLSKNEKKASPPDRLSFAIALIVSVCGEALYLYYNRMLPYVNMPGNEAALFIPIINMITAPLLMLINFANTTVTLRNFQLVFSPAAKFIALIFPVSGIIMVPALIILYPLFYLISQWLT